jgi:hypothetical protein
LWYKTDFNGDRLTFHTGEGTDKKWFCVKGCVKDNYMQKVHQFVAVTAYFQLRSCICYIKYQHFSPNEENALN